MHSIVVLLIAYTVAATLLTITPGLDTALVVRTATAEGPRRGVWAGLGIVTGCLIWTVIVAAGLGAVLVASQLAYTVLRWAGAVYLLYVGIRLLRNPRTGFVEEPGRQRRGGSAFARGALTNLLNPKVGVFYVTLLPQFVPAGAPIVLFSMLLAAIHAFQGIVWPASISYAVRFFSGWFRRPRVTKSIDRVTGTLLAGFGVELLFERR